MEYKGLTVEERQENYKSDLAHIKQSDRTQISFLGSPITLRMGVTLIGGCTGRGKSTVAANILASFYKTHPDKQALVISNEEISSDVLDRVSCILLSCNFALYKDNKLAVADELKVQALSLVLLKHIEVVNTSMTTLEDVQSVLKYAKDRDNINLLLLDYLQSVSQSREVKGLNQYEVSKRLGLFVLEYGKDVQIPFVVFAQMSPATQDGVNEFSTRIQGDKTFLNHCVMGLEIKPDFIEQTTEILVHKDRAGQRQGQSFSFKFYGGALSNL